MSEEEIIQICKEAIAKESKKPVESIDIHTSFENLGLDSISGLYILEILENKLQIKIDPMIYWDHSNISSFSKHIHQLHTDAL